MARGTALVAVDKVVGKGVDRGVGTEVGTEADKSEDKVGDTGVGRAVDKVEGNILKQRTVSSP